MLFISSARAPTTKRSAKRTYSSGSAIIRPRKTPGNQNGRELNFSNWYNGGWLGILRFKNAQEAEKAAQACEAGVRNQNIGYDMDGRNTAYKAAESVDLKAAVQKKFKKFF